MSTSHALRLLTGFATGAAVLVALFGAVAAQQPGTPTIKKGEYNAIVSPEGKDNFQAYCAVCHGIDGKGGGPAVPALKGPVPDLTTMARRYGKYDEVAVQNQIRGASKLPPAHGSLEMPIWGPLFKSRSSEAEVFLRVRNLAAYVGSIQVK
jgi:mono/diheme cytochrome c family protein